MNKRSAFDVGPTADEMRRVSAQARDLPRQQPARGPFVVLAVAVVVWTVTTVIVAMTLPDRVPVHWSGSTPDRWSSRIGAMAAFVVGPLVIAAILAVVSSLVVRWPQAVNVPHKEEWLRTPQRLRTLERRVREDMALFAALAFVFFAFVSVGTAVAARRPGGETPGVLVAGPILLFVGGILALLIGRMLLSKRYRADEHIDM